MAPSFPEAVAALSAPGQPFEINETLIRGVAVPTFVNAPQNLRVVFDGARRGGDDIFLVYEEERWSFATVMAHVDAIGALLVDTYRIAKGDRVAIAMRNYPEWVIANAAILSVGAISVSLNSWWTEDELAFALEDSGPLVLFADAERIARAAATCRRLGTTMIEVRTASPSMLDVARWDDLIPLGRTMPEVEIDPDDDATILYTSGTTGRPKGAVSTHRAVVSALFAYGFRAAVDRLRNPPGDQDRTPSGPTSFILIVPLFHVTGGVAVLLSCFAARTKLVIMYKWDVDKALQLIEREQITNFVGVPTQSWDLVNSPRFADFDTSSLRSVGGGGAPAPPALVQRLGQTMGRTAPSIGYGMTETNAYGPQNSGADYLAHPNSTGRILPIVKIEIRDPDGAAMAVGERGEIWFLGPNLIRGYWNRPDATAETIVYGWLRSGDLGYHDADGFLYIEDRIKDMILRGGENVYCAEVEAALYEHPGVQEAAVLGVPHARLGEEVVAVVVANGVMPLTVESLLAFVRPRLAAFKVPSQVLIFDAPLPRNAAGKFLKRELRQSF